jgi:hypothetical protein
VPLPIRIFTSMLRTPCSNRMGVAQCVLGLSGSRGCISRASPRNRSEANSWTCGKVTGCFIGGCCVFSGASSSKMPTCQKLSEAVQGSCKCEARFKGSYNLQVIQQDLPSPHGLFERLLFLIFLTQRFTHVPLTLDYTKLTVGCRYGCFGLQSQSHRAADIWEAISCFDP